MPITLPSTPLPASITPRYKSVRSVFRSPITGKAQVALRLADYFAIDVTMPAMEPNVAREWIAKLALGVSDTVLFPWPQPQAAIGAPGAPKVNGAGQTGTSLVIDGASPLYAWKAGQYFSVITTGGRRELKMLTEDGAADGSGAGEIHFRPPLRYAPADNADIELASPKIEGLIVANDVPYTVAANRAYTLSFSIEEMG